MPHIPRAFQSQFVITLHSKNPATLEWRIDGKQKEALFSEGDAIVNPAGLFVAPRWSAEVELLLLVIENHPLWFNRYGFPAHLEQTNRCRRRHRFEVNFMPAYKQFESHMC